MDLLEVKKMQNNQVLTSVTMFFLNIGGHGGISMNSSVIRQKGESQNGCHKKTKQAKFSEHF